MAKIKGWKKQVPELSDDFYENDIQGDVWNSTVTVDGNPKYQVSVLKDDISGRWIFTVYDVESATTMRKAHHFRKKPAMRAAIRYMRSHPNG